MRTYPPTGREVFARIWQQMAREGLCDEYGGEEYRRVSKAWRACGCPLHVRQFIRQEANRPAAKPAWNIDQWFEQQ